MIGRGVKAKPSAPYWLIWSVAQVVDLLPTRSAESLGEWLAQRPEVTTVSRDRQGVYAEGARRVAPEAVQVAHRFHLVLNLTQAVSRSICP
jgi:transposase